MNVLKDKDPIGDILLFFNVNLVINMLVDKLFGKKDEFRTVLHSASVTAAWVLGGVIEEKLNEGKDTTVSE